MTNEGDAVNCFTPKEKHEPGIIPYRINKESGQIVYLMDFL